MLTAVCPTDVLESQIAAQNETANSDIRLSDDEIMQRVRRIRSTWSQAERDARSEDADRRFEILLVTFFAEAA